MKRLIITTFAAIISICTLWADELKCTVQINYDQVPSANAQLFQTLQQEITDMLNNTKWTNLTYAEKERIECQVMIVCKTVSETGLYSCEATFQASRPVFNTSYNSPLINIKDKNFSFTWNGEPLNFQLNSFEQNLSCMLAYYAYLILGYDADSFQRLGGSPYFQICENVVTLCQTATMEDAEQVGWRAFERDANRYSITNNLMDEAFAPFRNFYYEYHRLGLDEMETNVDNGRARIYNNLDALRQAKKARMKSDILAVFLDSKADELVNIFQGGTATEKDGAYKLLSEVDPTRSNQYERINE